MIIWRRCFICIAFFLFFAISLIYFILFRTSEIYVSQNNKITDETVIIYNRIPKTGSTTVANILYKLCEDNGFHSLFINITKNSHILTPSNQKSFAQNVSLWNKMKPAIYHGHIAHINFARFGYPNPVYINFIRRPLDRLVSYYYFLRFGDDFRPFLVRSRMKNKKIQQQTFDDCVAEGGADCDPKNLWMQIPFFCGQAAFCWQEGSKEALAAAKRRVMEEYAFVGVTEDLRGGLEVLSSLLPRFFNGSVAMYDRGGALASMRRTIGKKPLLAQTVAAMKQSVTWRLENDFYEFVHRQFMRDLELTRRSAPQVIGYRRVRPR